MKSTSSCASADARCRRARRPGARRPSCARRSPRRDRPRRATACGLPPTSIVSAACAVAGSIRVTVPSPLFATQTEPAPTATPAGACADRDRRRDRSRGRDRCGRRCRRACPRPRRRRPRRDPARPVADRDRRQQPGGIDADDRVGTAVGDPDRVRRRPPRPDGPALGSIALHDSCAVAGRAARAAPRRAQPRPRAPVRPPSRARPGPRWRYVSCWATVSN